MKLAGKIALYGMTACILSQAQGDGGRQFEVASVKPAALGTNTGIKGGPGTPDPAQMTYYRISLRTLVQIAYDVIPVQLSEPSWMETAYFDIVAKAPAGATIDDRRPMMKNLLEQRFHLKAHHESRETSAYALMLGKGLPKMNSYPVPLPAGFSAVLAFQGSDKDGFPFAAPGHVFGMKMSKNGRTVILLAHEPMKSLCDSLSGVLQEPVVDQTGLTERYDFRLIFASDESATPAVPNGEGSAVPSAPDPAPSIFSALENELGLKLQRKKLPVDFLVVDHADKTPTEN